METAGNAGLLVDAMLEPDAKTPRPALLSRDFWNGPDLDQALVILQGVGPVIGLARFDGIVTDRLGYAFALFLPLWPVEHDLELVTSVIEFHILEFVTPVPRLCLESDQLPVAVELGIPAHRQRPAQHRGGEQVGTSQGLVRDIQSPPDSSEGRQTTLLARHVASNHLRCLQRTKKIGIRILPEGPYADRVGHEIVVRGYPRLDTGTKRLSGGKQLVAAVGIRAPSLRVT